MGISLFENVIYKMCLEIIYLIYVLKGFSIKRLTNVDMPEKQSKIYLE